MRFAFRRLRKNAVISIAAILSLAIAMGASIAAFELVNALLLRPLPIDHPDRLYALSRDKGDSWKYSVFRRMRESVAGQAQVIAMSFAERAELTFHSDREMEKAHVQYVSGDMFRVFGIRAATGRLFTENDDRFPGQHLIAVISDDYWARRFARDPHVIGQTYRLPNNLTGTRIYQIIGVAQPGFVGTEPGKRVDIFMPSMMHWGIAYPNWRLFRVFAMLQPGISASAIREHLAPIAPVFILAAPAGVSSVQSDYTTPLAALNILVALVLLVATVNVANLLTAQTAARSHEMALRISIGASRHRLFRLVLSEAALIGISASTLAWCFAQWAAPFVVSRISLRDSPLRLSVTIDWHVVAFGFALTLAVTCLFGIAPALRASAINPIDALKGADKPHTRARWMRLSIAVQSAFCILVLFVAALFVATFDRLHNQYNGYNSAGLLNVDVVNPINEPSAVWDQVADQLRHTAGVESVAYADWPLMDGYGFKTNGVSINGGPPSDVSAWFMNVSPGWIATMQISFLAGRDFRSTDLSPGVAIVNEAFARQFFNGENPIGKSFAGTSSWMGGQEFEIIGLVRDARYRFLRQPVLPVAFTPFNRNSDAGKMQGGTIVIRTNIADPRALAATLTREIARTRSDFRVSQIRTQQDLIELQTVRESLLATLARFFGLVALLLAGIGLYGVLDYSVLQRHREIGIRIALGAQPTGIARNVTAAVFSMVLLGAVAGLAMGLAAADKLTALLYQVKPTEFAILAIPSLAIVATAMIAALPAVIHAVEIDPAALLRTD